MLIITVMFSYVKVICDLVGIFPLQYNPQNLDLSHKIDLNRALDKREYLVIHVIRDNFCKFCTKTWCDPSSEPSQGFK